MKKRVTICLESENFDYLESIRSNYGPSLSFLLDKLVSEQKQREAVIKVIQQDGQQSIIPPSLSEVKS
jgi:hypothetical protein